MQGTAADDLRVVVSFGDPELLDVLVKRDRRFVEQDAVTHVRVEETTHGRDIAGTCPADGDGFSADFRTFETFGALC
ncbi:hypothetical protein [Streptomyces sp. MAI_2237]